MNKVSHYFTEWWQFLTNLAPICSFRTYGQDTLTYLEIQALWLVEKRQQRVISDMDRSGRVILQMFGAIFKSIFAKFFFSFSISAKFWKSQLWKLTWKLNFEFYGTLSQENQYFQYNRSYSCHKICKEVAYEILSLLC